MQNIAIDTCVTRAVPLGLALTLVLAVSSWGGTKMLSEPESLRFASQPIPATSDQFLSVALVKWPAGERFPAHSHFGGEEIYVKGQL